MKDAQITPDGKSMVIAYSTFRYWVTRGIMISISISFAALGSAFLVLGLLVLDLAIDFMYVLGFSDEDWLPVWDLLNVVAGLFYFAGVLFFISYLFKVGFRMQHISLVATREHLELHRNGKRIESFSWNNFEYIDNNWRYKKRVIVFENARLPIANLWGLAVNWYEVLEFVGIDPEGKIHQNPLIALIQKIQFR